MLGFAGSSYALFALVWGLMCVVSGILVTETMLRDNASASLHDVERHGDATAELDGLRPNG